MVEPQATSPINSMTPPKSPLKPLPNPHASPRSSSQQLSQHSSSRSHSGQHDQKQALKHATAKPRRSSRDVESSSPRLERAMSAKRVEPILRGTTPEPPKPPKNLEPPMPSQSHRPSTQEESIPMTSHPQSPASVVTTTPTSPERRASIRAARAPVVVEPPEPMLPNKRTDPIIAAREGGAKPVIPARSASRTKPSFATFTERARFHLGRKKSPSQELGENDTSSTDLPIQSPSSRHSPANRPSSPVFQRLSTRRANAISTSTHSASASPSFVTEPADSPLSRNESPALQFDSGARKPSHSSYNSTSFLPRHPQLSPLPDYSARTGEAAPESDKSLKRSSSVNSGMLSKRASTIDSQAQIRRSSSISTGNRRTSIVTSSPGLDRALSVSHAHPKRSSSVTIPNSRPILDDAGGSVNLQHPLLREARHAKFATTTEPNSPIHRGDLPLRHYASANNIHSIGFAGRPREIIMPPKRTSSLLYNRPAPTSPSAHPALSSAPLDDNEKLSPAPARSSATPAPLNVSSRPDTAASARRDLETARSSPATATASSDTSDDSEDATPPPIGRGVRSTPSMVRLDTNVHSKPQSEAATSPAMKSPSSKKSLTSPSTKPGGTTSPITSPPPDEKPKFKTSATNNIPFYLNPVSSAALIDFLASTPPPSPPQPQHSNTDPKAFDTQNLYKNYRIDNGKSPVPPGPGGMPMLPLNLAQASPRVKSVAKPETHGSKKAGWKKMFGGARGDKKSSSQKIPTSMPNSHSVKAPKQVKKAKSQVLKKGIRDDWEDMTAKQGRHVGNGNGNGSGNSIFKMRGFNMSRGSMSMGKGNAKEKDEEMSQVESTTSTPVASSSVNGSAVGQSQSFMGVGKDGMWISRKNFLRT